MNREIKCRARDKVREEYLYSDKFPSMWQFFKELEHRGIRHFETEWFTGLYDKNGKAIYEGDKVKEYRVPLGCGSKEKWEELSREVLRVASVVWDNEELTYSVKDTRIGVLNGWGNLEVIGNIWENPELMENV